MKYFVAIEEDLLLELWMHNPNLVIPFSRPFYPRESASGAQRLNLEVKTLLPASSSLSLED